MNETFVVALREPSGGYRWILTAAAAHVALQRENLIATKAVAPGSGALREFQLYALQPGVYKLHFVLVRHWEKAVQQEHVETVAVID